VHAAKRKGFFDLYGEEGLKDGVPDGQGGRRACLQMLGAPLTQRMPLYIAGIKGGIYRFDPETTPTQVCKSATAKN
jgi:hypothetical protein